MGPGVTLTDEDLTLTPGLLSRWVRLTNGVRAHYMTAGEAGPAVVLLHGGLLGSSGAAGWAELAVHLASQGFRVYCPDQPSFGHTEDPAAFYAPGQVGHVDFLHDFTTALCLEEFHLAGNSMGSNNAVNYVLAHPERVLSFILVAGHVGDIVSPKAIGETLGDIGFVRPELVRFDGTTESVRRMLAGIVKTAVDDLDLLEMRTRAARRTEVAHGRHTEAMFAPPDPALAARLRTRGRLNATTVPGICLHGRDDTLIPVQVAYLQEDALPNIQFFYPENCGHQGQTDQPELFAEVFTEFFTTGRVSDELAPRAGISDRRPPLERIVGAP